MLWDEPKIFFLERRYFFSIILSEFLKNRVALQRKLHENQEQSVKNSTAYTMAVLFNCIAESESDLLVDPYLNALSSTA